MIYTYSAIVRENRNERVKTLINYFLNYTFVITPTLQCITHMQYSLSRTDVAFVSMRLYNKRQFIYQ